MEALRFNNNKIKYSTIHPVCYRYLKQYDGDIFLKGLEAFCRVGTVGAEKYDAISVRMNYGLGGKPALEYLDSAARHLVEIAKGIYVDPETTQRHLHHVLWNVLVFASFSEAGLCQPLDVPLHLKTNTPADYSEMDFLDIILDISTHDVSDGDLRSLIHDIIIEC